MFELFKVCGSTRLWVILIDNPAKTLVYTRVIGRIIRTTRTNLNLFLILLQIFWDVKKVLKFVTEL